MPTAATIGPRGLARLSAAAFLAAALMLAATAAFIKLAGGGGPAPFILFIVAAGWALLGGYVLRAARKPEPRLYIPTPHHVTAFDPEVVEILPPEPGEEEREQRY